MSTLRRPADERSSAISTPHSTEDKIQRAIGRILDGRTTLLITHRLSQIRWAGQVLLLRRGELVDCEVGWNREHVWAQSHGSFATAAGPGTDLHHLRPTDVQVNSIRGNKDFDNVSGAPGNYTDSNSFEPRVEFWTGCTWAYESGCAGLFRG